MTPSATHPPHAEAPGLDPAAVCTLPPADLRDRVAWVQEEILPHVVASGRLDRGLALELTAVPGLTEKLDHWIRLEAECCSGIRFERLASAHEGRLRFEIRGIDPEAEIFRSLGVDGAAPPSVGARFAKATGLGVIGSLFVCCVLPIAAAALLGGAVAAPFARLDAPVPIVGIAVLGTAAAWWWLGRRRARAALVDAPPSGCGC